MLFATCRLKFVITGLQFVHYYNIAIICTGLHLTFLFSSFKMEFDPLIVRYTTVKNGFRLRITFSKQLI